MDFPPIIEVTLWLVAIGVLCNFVILMFALLIRLVIWIYE